MTDFAAIATENRNKYWNSHPYEFLPGISIDCVIFGFHDGELKILLNKILHNPKWMLPGGFIQKNEDLEDAAYKILESRTGLDHIFLKQFYTFGKATRTKPDENEILLNILKENRSPKELEWFTSRFVTVAYYACVDYKKVEIKANEGENLQWFLLKDVPLLYSDHSEILEEGLKELRKNIKNAPFGLELLPKTFIMSELRIIYESILDRKLDRRNFQRKMLSTGYIIKLNEMVRKQGIKPSNLFSFDIEKYNQGFSLFE